MQGLNPQRHLPLIIGALLATAITVVSALAIASLAARPI
jgi:predicted outer membrane lipoprotein